MNNDLERHRLADKREALGVCSICVTPHAECDCVKDGNSKTRRDAWEEIHGLRQAESACTLHPVGEGDAIRDLEARVRKMRELGVTRWDGIELGPVPSAATSPEEDETQRSMMLEQQKQADADRAYRLRFGASGGPRPALARNR